MATNEERIQVLLVEDSPSDAELLCELLQNYPPQKFAIERAERLEAAIRLVAERTFDVVLLDLTLPDSAGLDTCTRMCRAAPQVPIVVLTGVDDETVALEAMQQGVKDYLVKGQIIHGGTIGRTIRYAVERSRSEQALRESEERYRRLFNEALTGDFLARPDGKVIECNPAFAEIYGFRDCAAATQGSLSQFNPPEWAYLRDRVKTECKVQGHQCVHRRPDGTEIHVVANLVGRFDEAGQLVEVKGYLFDDTQRQRAEEQLREAHQHLQVQTEQLRAANEELNGQAEELAAQAEELRAANEDLRAQDAALRESEERLKRSQEIAHLGSWELDLVHNRLTWSDEVYRIFGLQPQKFGATYEAFLARVHPEDRAAVDAAYSGSLRENRDTYEIEHRVVRPSTGEVRVVHEKCEHFRDASGRIVRSVGMVHDITERKRAVEQLRKLYRTLRALGHSSHALIHATEESAYLQEVCRIIVEDCGYALVWIGYAEEDEARSVRPVAHAGFEEGYLETLRITWADTERGCGPTGTAIRTGRPCLCHNMLTDPNFAPWREQAAQRGYASSVALPLLSGGRTLGAVTLYSRDPDPFSPDEVKLLMELAADLAYGITFLRLRTAHAQAEAQLRRLNDQLEKKVQARTEELKDTVDRLQEEVLRRTRAEGDLRQRSQMLEHRAHQLQKLTLELSQAEERERKRLAEVLHDDLQQVLTASTFHLHILRSRLKNNKALQDITGHVNELLKEAIDTSRSLSHDLSPVLLYRNDLGTTFEWLAQQVQAKHGLAVHVEVRDHVDSPSDAHKAFLFRAAQEILFNIVKHAEVKEARVRLQRMREQLWLTIGDQGQGFDPMSLDKTAGFGLLSIRERVELLGGRMKIRSAKGRGSTFLIAVPDAEVADPPRAGAERQVRRGTATRKPTKQAGERVLRVLLVDDHQVVREGLATLLGEQRDMEIVGQAGDGREAVDLASLLEPDVIIMDATLPGMAGDEATRQIKLHQPQMRIVALSMFEEAQMAETMRQAGAEIYLVKTAPSEQLLAAIRGRPSGAP